MPIVEKGVTGADQENKAKQMPFQLLGKYKTGIEDIAHEDIDEDHHYQSGRYPGDTTANPFVQGIDPAANGLKCFHFYNPCF
jgi:hypothetical protein